MNTRAHYLVNQNFTTVTFLSNINDGDDDDGLKSLVDTLKKQVKRPSFYNSTPFFRISTSHCIIKLRALLSFYSFLLTFIHACETLVGMWAE